MNNQGIQFSNSHGACAQNPIVEPISHQITACIQQKPSEDANDLAFNLATGSSNTNSSTPQKITSSKQTKALAVSTGHKATSISNMKRKLNDNIVSLRKQKRRTKMLVERGTKSGVFGLGKNLQEAQTVPTHLMYGGADASAKLDSMIRNTAPNVNQIQVPEKRPLKQVIVEMQQNDMLDLKADATHKDILDHLEKAASYFYVHAQIEVDELELILELLINKDNLTMRFIASFAIHKLIRNKLNTKVSDDQGEPPLRAWLKIENHNDVFLELLSNTMFMEQCIPVKAMVAECICDFIKLAHKSMFETLILKSEFVQKSILVIDQLTTSKIAISPEFIHMKGEINKLAYNIVWSLGMINSERTDFANIFTHSGGVAVCLALIEQYLNHCEMLESQFDEELESVVTYALTSSCYEGECEDYTVIKPIMGYLQDQLMRQDFSEDQVCNESLMGLEAIICAGGSQAIKDFMEYENIDALLKKMLNFLSESIKKLLRFVDYDRSKLMMRQNSLQEIQSLNQFDEEAEMQFHWTFPSIQSIQELIISLLDDNDEATPRKLVDLNLIDIMQTLILVYAHIPENYYWNDCFKQFITMFGSLVASGVEYAENLLRGTQIPTYLFDLVVFKTEFHQRKLKGSLITEFAQMIQNVVRIEDDWCQDHLLAIDIVKVIIYLAHEARFGTDICLAALDALGEILEYNEGYQSRMNDVRQVVAESEDLKSGENGLAVLELLAFHENEDVREKASEILENQLNYYMEVAFENILQDNSLQFKDNNKQDNQTSESQDILQMIQTGQIQPTSSSDPSQIDSSSNLVTSENIFQI